MKLTTPLTTFCFATALFLGAATTPMAAQTLTGSGSTFINPIMGPWTTQYWKTKHVKVSYEPVGSGGGIADIINSETDFTGSDVPMNATELQEAHDPVVSVPDVIGGVAVVYHVPGVGPGIHLTGPVLADIFLGKIKYWDDSQITALSPGTSFPHTKIIPLHRKDGSGTTAIFTDYLSKVSHDWAAGPGTGKFITWPVGADARRSSGIVGTVKGEENTISYVELAYAIKFTVYYASVQNARGQFIYPTSESCGAAADGVAIPSNLNISLTNTPNKAAYPITGFSYLMTYQSSAKAGDLKKFMEWVVTTGQDVKFTRALSYAPLPRAIQAADMKALETLK